MALMGEQQKSYKCNNTKNKNKNINLIFFFALNGWWPFKYYVNQSEKPQDQQQKQ